VSQSAYTDDLLKEYNMTDCNTIKSPMCAGYRQYRLNLSAREQDDTDNLDDAEPISYATLMGKINWLVVKTRPDLQYAVFRLQRYMHQPLKYDICAAKRILRYLRGNAYELVLGQEPSKAEEIYVDAAFQDHETGHSTAGFVIFFAGAPVSWGSRKESIIAPSSTIAELIAFDDAVKEGLYVKKLAIALELRSDSGPLTIRTDSANALKLLQKPGFPSNRTVRWINNKYFFVYEELQQGNIQFTHIEGKKNVADGLTKPLDGTEFEGFMTRLRLKRSEGESENSN
jgi:hypothetical protein